MATVQKSGQFIESIKGLLAEAKEDYERWKGLQRERKFFAGRMTMLERIMNRPEEDLDKLRSEATASLERSTHEWEYQMHDGRLMAVEDAMRIKNYGTV